MNSNSAFSICNLTWQRLFQNINFQQIRTISLTSIQTDRTEIGAVFNTVASQQNRFWVWTRRLAGKYEYMNIWMLTSYLCRFPPGANGSNNNTNFSGIVLVIAHEPASCSCPVLSHWFEMGRAWFHTSTHQSEQQVNQNLITAVGYQNSSPDMIKPQPHSRD